MTSLLFRHLLESTIFCVLFGSLTLCLRRQAGAVRHSVWLISVLKFSIPTVLFTVTGAWIAFALPATAWVSLWAAKVSAVLAGLFGVWPFHMVVGTTLSATVCLIAWIAGSAIMIGIWAARLRKCYNGLSLPSDEEWAALDRAKRRLDLRKIVDLRCSERAKEPALVGILHPLITIPAGLFEELTESEFESVLLHELAHARRCDNLVSTFVHCLVCLFWFHPLLWFVEKRLIAERERACDEMVLACGVMPKTYLAGILKVCRFHLFRDVAGVCAMNGSALDRRSNQILAYRAAQPVPYAVRLAMAGFALLVTILPMAGGYCQQCVSNGQGMTKASTHEFLRKDRR